MKGPILWAFGTDGKLVPPAPGGSESAVRRGGGEAAGVFGSSKVSQSKEKAGRGQNWAVERQAERRTGPRRGPEMVADAEYELSFAMDSF